MRRGRAVGQACPIAAHCHVRVAYDIIFYCITILVLHIMLFCYVRVLKGVETFTFWFGPAWLIYCTIAGCFIVSVRVRARVSSLTPGWWWAGGGGRGVSCRAGGVCSGRFLALRAKPLRRASAARQRGIGPSSLAALIRSFRAPPD